VNVTFNVKYNFNSLGVTFLEDNTTAQAIAPAGLTITYDGGAIPNSVFTQTSFDNSTGVAVRTANLSLTGKAGTTLQLDFTRPTSAQANYWLFLAELDFDACLRRFRSRFRGAHARRWRAASGPPAWLLFQVADSPRVIRRAFLCHLPRSRAHISQPPAPSECRSLHFSLQRWAWLPGRRLRTPQETRKHPNILLFAIDSLLADHMSCYGYPRLTTPHIDKFAAQGTLFRADLLRRTSRRRRRTRRC
jgi:hypothetical protein